MDITKSYRTTATKLERITQRSTSSPRSEFKWLMPLFTKDALVECFHSLDGNKAVGIDGVRKGEYGKALDENLDQLIKRMKTMSYRPSPVREVLIPKEGQKGKYRPLGISNLEDKVVQVMIARVLEAIYEPVFLDCSYGFRPKRSCHDALKATHKYTFFGNCRVVIDVDLENFFGTIDHQTLLNFLRIKIKDERFIRYIARMLKAGCFANKEFRVTDEGFPQGNVASPILANIYAHYVIDLWFEGIVKKRLIGDSAMFRYCDDIVICCGGEVDAQRISRSLNQRLHKYHLRMNKEKTQIVRFNRFDKGRKQESFDFLGFTFYFGRNRNGKMIPKLRTSRKRLRSKLKAVTGWCQTNRSKARLVPLWKVFNTKLQGHINYYGVSFNLPMVNTFVYESQKIFLKWMNRRSQRKSLCFEDLRKLAGRYPPPTVKVHHRLY